MTQIDGSPDGVKLAVGDAVLTFAFRTRTLTLERGGRLAWTRTMTSWGVPRSSPRECPGHPAVDLAHEIAGVVPWVDPGKRTVVFFVAFDGNDSCSAPTPRPHVVRIR